MKVETFECVETASEPIEAGEEAIALIESLGLEGQQTLISKKDGARDSRCPYREMTAEEAFVYGVMCPTVSKLEAYNRTPIPLRVLQLAAHAKSLDIFTAGLVVWDAASPAEKDPVLIGLMPRGEETWRGNRQFILARWGEELETFAVLAKRAFKAKREALTQQLESAKSAAIADMTRLVSMSDGELVSRGANAHPFYSSL